MEHPVPTEDGTKAPLLDNLTFTERVEQFKSRGCKDPLTLVKDNTLTKLVHSPFQFYSGFVELSLKEKSKMVENHINKYYKDCIQEMEDKNKVLEMSVNVLKDMN